MKDRGVERERGVELVGEEVGGLVKGVVGEGFFSAGEGMRGAIWHGRHQQ